MLLLQRKNKFTSKVHKIYGYNKKIDILHKQKPRRSKNK